MKPVLYRRDPEDVLVLILKNGRRLKQKPGVDLFLSKIGEVYSLTRYGLRRLRVDVHPKRRYGQRSRNGVKHGRRYPYVVFRKKVYTVHILMEEIWVRPCREGEEVDHLDGNIYNCRLDNLEIVTKEENRRRSKILKAMRKDARELNDPSLDPRNKTPEEMKAIYKDFRF